MKIIFTKDASIAWENYKKWSVVEFDKVKRFFPSVMSILDAKDAKEPKEKPIKKVVKKRVVKKK